MSQVKKNFIYNVMYQILILILPLITVPYVSRTLGAEGIGMYSYTYSIVYYFMMIALLGINNHGNRTIAKVRENKEQLSKSFWGIYIIQLVMSLIMIICYFIYLWGFNNKFFSIAVLQSVYLISNALDINWFFFGLEKFKITVTRSTIVKLLSFFLILAFVKTPNHVWLYTIIMGGSTLISQALLIVFLKKEITKVKIEFSDIKKHIKPCIIMFIPVISISLYKVMDKIMLGSITNVREVGYYEQAEKIINIPLGIVTALGTVMLPRISNLVSKGDKVAILNYIRSSIKFMMFLAFPICFGLIAVSEEFVPLFMGDEFIQSAIIINYLSVTILFISFANVIRKQYLVPMEKDKIFIASVILGAFINLIMNFIFIPKMASIGACIGTISAEFIVMFYQVLAVRKELELKEYLKSISSFLIKALIMFMTIYLLNYINIDINNIAKLIIKIVIGVIIYGVLNIKYINSVINIKNIINKILKKFYYPKILLNNYKFMKYVIDKDYNNLAYVNTDKIYSENLEEVIDYTFRKVYYMKIKDNSVNFDLDGVFKNSKIVKNEYFNECLSYIKRMEGREIEK